MCVNGVLEHERLLVLWWYFLIIIIYTNLHLVRIEINRTNNKEDQSDDESDDESEADATTEDDIVNKISVSNVLDVQPCGAHTLNLCITDVTKPYNENLTRIRNFLKKAKLLKYHKLHEMHKVPKPNLDNATRWAGTHRMLKPLLKYREFYGMLSDNLVSAEKKFQLSQDDWHFIENFVEAFEPASVCIDRIQAEQLTVGDFFWAWSEMKLELEDIKFKNEMAAELLEAVSRREGKLKENDAIVAAIYFDPRYNFNGSTYLSKDEKERAQV